MVWYHTDLQRMDVQEHLSQGGVRKMVDRMSPILRSLARLSTIKCALPTIAAHFEIETIIYHNLSNIWVFSQDLFNFKFAKKKRFARGGSHVKE